MHNSCKINFTEWVAGLMEIKANSTGLLGRFRKKVGRLREKKHANQKLKINQPFNPIRPGGGWIPPRFRKSLNSA
jgi:hypothetical protein